MVGDNKPPEEVMYRYTKFTTRVMDNGGLKWVSTDTDTCSDFFPPRGYFTKGDSGENVRKIDEFFANKVKGDFYGDYSVAIVKEFQRQNGLEQDGNIGPKTLAKMVEQGFKE
jgi:murein L,D-transpeptidase YcbB/YkuD